MDESTVLSLAREALTVVVLLSSPFLLVSLVVGSVISLLQAATQVNEVTLTFVPKIIGIILVILLLGGWLLQQIVSFTVNLYTNLPNLAF